MPANHRSWQTIQLETMGLAVLSQMQLHKRRIGFKWTDYNWEEDEDQFNWESSLASSAGKAGRSMVKTRECIRSHLQKKM